MKMDAVFALLAKLLTSVAAVMSGIGSLIIMPVVLMALSMPPILAFRTANSVAIAAARARSPRDVWLAVLPSASGSVAARLGCIATAVHVRRHPAAGEGFEVMRMFKKGQFRLWIEAVGGGTDARFVNHLFGIYA
jgi:uncharacterized membrane protein YfcA